MYCVRLCVLSAVCVCGSLIGACVRVRLPCYTNVFVWLVCDLVCDVVSLCLFVL